MPESHQSTMWAECVVKVRFTTAWVERVRLRFMGIKPVIGGNAVAAKVKKHVLATRGPLTEPLRERYKSSIHYRDSGPMGPEYLTRLLAVYDSRFLDASVFWIEDAHNPSEAGFFVILEPKRVPGQVRSLALHLYDEVASYLPQGLTAVSHKLTMVGVQHHFQVITPNSPFLTPDGKAAVGISILFGAGLWALTHYGSQPDEEPWKSVWGYTQNLLVNVLSSGVFALGVLALTWRSRRKQSESDRKVVYSDGV